MGSLEFSWGSLNFFFEPYRIHDELSETGLALSYLNPLESDSTLSGPPPFLNYWEVKLFRTDVHSLTSTITTDSIVQ